MATEDSCQLEGKPRDRLLDALLAWTGVTAGLVWAAAAHPTGTPKGHRSSLVDWAGIGLEPGFAFLLMAAAGVSTLLSDAVRARRRLFAPALVMWHGAVTGLVGVAIERGGSADPVSSLGIRFLFVLGSLAAVVWSGQVTNSTPSTIGGKKGSKRIQAATVLLGVAFALVWAPIHPNWVTGLAILGAAAHWVGARETAPRR